MKKEIIVKSETLRERAAELVGMIPLDKDHIVIIKPHSETLLQKQRALYFRWVRQYMAPDLGYENYKDLHEQLKESFLVPLLIADNKGYADMVDAVIAVRRENEARAEALKKQILKLTSIRDEGLVNKAVMSEYMRTVEIHSNKLGCFLPRPGEEA